MEYNEGPKVRLQQHTMQHRNSDFNNGIDFPCIKFQPGQFNGNLPPPRLHHPTPPPRLSHFDSNKVRLFQYGTRVESKITGINKHMSYSTPHSLENGETSFQSHNDSVIRDEGMGRMRQCSNDSNNKIETRKNCTFENSNIESKIECSCCNRTASDTDSRQAQKRKFEEDANKTEHISNKKLKNHVRYFLQRPIVIN